MALEIIQNITYALNITTIGLLLFLLIRKRLTVSNVQRILLAYREALPKKSFNQIATAHTHPGGSDPYVNDYYKLYTLNSSLQLEETPLEAQYVPSDYYFDILKSTFVRRPSDETYAIKDIQPNSIEYPFLGVSKLNDRSPFQFERKVQNNNGTEFKIVRRARCQNNANKKLPLYRQEYNRSLGISTIGYRNDRMLAGYILCKDDVNYSVQLCATDLVFDISLGQCMPVEDTST